MKLGIECFITFTLIALLVVFGATYNNQTVEMSNAKQFGTAMTAKMDSANFTKEIVDECKKEASENGYDSLTVKKSNTRPDIYEVALTYHINILFTTSTKTYVVVNYANVPKTGNTFDK